MLRTFGLELAEYGIFTTPLLFDGPIQLLKMHGVFSYAPPWERRFQCWRQALIWLRIPGYPGDPKVSVGQTIPKSETLGGGIGEGIWSANVKVFDQPGCMPMTADFGQAGLVILNGQIDFRWDIRSYQNGQEIKDPKQALDAEVQFTLVYNRL